VIPSQKCSAACCLDLTCGGHGKCQIVLLVSAGRSRNINDAQDLGRSRLKDRGASASPPFALGERSARERMRRLEVCLKEISGSGAAGLMALDRVGRLVHATGRTPSDVGVGERVPGLDRDVPVADWAGRLPTGWQPDWLNAVVVDRRRPDHPRRGPGSAEHLCRVRRTTRNGVVLIILSDVVPQRQP
jgi:hypothetical protein